MVEDGERVRGLTPARPLPHLPATGPPGPAPDSPDLALGAFDGWPAPAAIIGADGRLLVVNDAWRRLGTAGGGGTAVEVGADYLAVCDATTDTADGRSVGAGLRAILDGDARRFDHTYRCDIPGGGPRWFQLTASRVAGATSAAMVVHTDVSDRERLQGDVHARSHLLDQVDAAVVVTDLDGTVTLWNRGAEELFGWTTAEALARRLTELTATPSSPQGATDGPALANATSSWEGVFTLRHRDGNTFPAQVRNTVVHDAAGEPTGLVGVSIDLSVQRAMEEQLLRSHRELQAITDGMGDGVCRIDPHGAFTYVNVAAQRLLGADDSDILGTAVLRWLAPRDRTHADDLVAVGGHATPTPVECTLLRSDGTELPVEYLATPLAPNGDGPRDWVVVFRDITGRQDREATLKSEIEELRWQRRIREALNDDGFVLYAQPIVEIATGEAVHHELLIRMRDAVAPTWLHPPAVFIPIAEAGGLAPLIDRWVIGQAVELAAAGYHLHVNLSSTSLADDSLPREIGRLLAHADVTPQRLVFEITETALLGDLDAARHFAEQLRELGCGLALDDFGTGYGGFTYLKQLPIDALKIDIEFVRDAVTSAASRHVIAAVVSLAQAFGLRTVAEGVEDAATLELLREAGVDWAQGYLLGRPAPLADILPTPGEHP